MSEPEVRELPVYNSAERRRRIIKILQVRPHSKPRDIARELGVDVRTVKREFDKVAGHGGGSGGRWLVSYADFVTLMFGFFLILWASASQDPVKFSELALAFQRAFNTGSMLGQQATGEIVGQGGRMGQIQISPFARVSESAGELVAQMGLQDEVSIGSRKEGLVITLSGSLLFESGKAGLREEATDVLARLANILDSTEGRIRIEGHSDNIPISTDEFPSNWELSSNRASAVLRFLTEVVGLPSERFEVAGYAEYRPLYPNDSRENRAKNRRVEIILMAPHTPSGQAQQPPVPTQARVIPTPAASLVPAKPGQTAKP